MPDNFHLSHTIKKGLYGVQYKLNLIIVNWTDAYFFHNKKFLMI